MRIVGVRRSRPVGCPPGARRSRSLARGALIGCLLLGGLGGAAALPFGVVPPAHAAPTPPAEEAGPQVTGEPTEPGESPTDPTDPTDPTQDPTDVPAESPIDVPTQSPTGPTPEPTVPTPEQSTTPPAEASVPPPGGAGSPPPTTGVLEPDPPAYTENRQSPITWAIAAAVLVAGAIIGFVLSRRSPRLAPPSQQQGTTPALGPDPATSAATGAALEAAGEAMIDAGYSVTAVRLALDEIARVNGHPDTEVVVFPTALFVSARGVGEVRTGAVSSGHARLTLAQIDALDDVVAAARTAATDPLAIIEGVQAVRRMPAPYSLAQRVVAHGALSAGVSVLLGASWTGIGVAAILGLVVGWVLARTAQVQQQYQALVTVGLSFGVACVVLALTTAGLDPGVLPSLIAPLVTLLPGALLTTGVIELFTGHMMSGAGRLAAGVMQLVLLAAGVVGASALIGVPGLALVGSAQPIGPLGPWLAVAAFGTGVVIHQSGRLHSIGWILLVLYVAYGAQVIADIFLGGVLSAFAGALAMTPVAVLAARQPSGPAAFVSFLPAFWLLVPGALGLVGVASILDGNSSGLNTLNTTASTMVAIALGTLAGAAVSSRLVPAHRALL